MVGKQPYVLINSADFLQHKWHFYGDKSAKTFQPLMSSSLTQFVYGKTMRMCFWGCNLFEFVITIEKEEKFLAP